jgi:drug/metabolite transporter (DMT)-like permease
LSPFASALLAYWMFGDKLSSKKWLGLFVGCVGFLPILINETSTEELTGHIWFFSWAEIAVMIAAFTSVYGWSLLKQLVNENGLSSIMANGLSMTIGGVFALVHSAFVENWNPIPVNEVAPFLDCMLLLIAISNLICYNLYGYLLKKYSVTFVSFAGFITPLFTALFGWWYLGEVVTWPFYVSAIIVFAGLCIFNQEELYPAESGEQEYLKSS